MSPFLVNTFTMTIVTLLSYIIGLKLFRKLQKTWLNPLFTATVFLIVLLPLLKIDYRVYTQGTQIFTLLLGTSTVALAIPLYKQWRLLKKNLNKIGLSILFGSFSGVFSIVVLAKLAHFDNEMLATLLSKSVSLPVALSVSAELGGVASLTVLCVLFSALFSLICGPQILTWLGIKSTVAKGLALGSAAQSLGASQALQWGEEAGAMGSVGMSTAAVLMCIMMPFLSAIIS
jgi:putative effector of murein hydrolase